MIATLKLDPARTQLISGFVDSYLRLNEVEENQFQTELKSLGLVEEEQVMEIVTSWMEKGIERGIQQGIQQGIQSGEKNLVFRQLNRRLGAIPKNLTAEINNLSLEKIESLAEALLDFEKQEDLLNWLEVNRE
jgi:predicted transposase YdaD